MNITFFVAGVPAPQGSKTSYGRGRIVDSADTGKVRNAGKMWSEAVRMEAIKAMAGRAPLEGPVRLTLIFHIKRPKSHMGARGDVKPRHASRWHTVRPDGSKIARRVEDAMSGVVYQDDSQIVHKTVAKVWTTSRAGVEITVETPIGIPTDDSGGTSPPPTP